jgi:flagellin-like protein
MKSVIGTLILLAIILSLAYCSGTRTPEQREIIEPDNSNQQQLQRNGDYLVFNAAILHRGIVILPAASAC